MKFVLYVFFLLPHPPSFSHLTSVQLFEQLYLLLNQTQAINITKKLRKKKKEIERSRGEERRKLPSMQAMSLNEALTATVINRFLSNGGLIMFSFTYKRANVSTINILPAEFILPDWPSVLKRLIRTLTPYLFCYCP